MQFNGKTQQQQQQQQQSINKYNCIIEKNQSNSIINKFQVVNPYDDYDDRLKFLETIQKNSSLYNILCDLFLPNGYPDSVTTDYFGYQFWDSIQAVCSTITGTLATRAILKGYGVGDSSATVASATTQWLIRDGMGMIGRILFAWRKGTDLDCNSKKWRYSADILNNIGMAFEMISPLFSHQLFLPLSCIGLIAKSICGVAGGCTKASLTQHFAKRDNLADVSAKDGSQETAVNLVGMILSVLVSNFITDNTSLIATWLVFLLFTTLHLFCNYRAVSAVQLKSINRYRAYLIYDYFIHNQGSIPSPAEISKLENILFGIKELDIRVGVSLCNIYKVQQKQQFLQEKLNKLTKNRNVNNINNNNNNNNNNQNNNSQNNKYKNNNGNNLNNLNNNNNINNRGSIINENGNLSNNSNNSNLEIIKKIKKSKSFIIWKKHSQRGIKILEKDFTLLIALLNGSTTRDMIESYFYAVEYFHLSSVQIPPTINISGTFFKRLEEKGWDLDRALLNSEGWTFGI
ncbi:hypothetical protein RB653_003086 [Dictyostelium firmibasis]|uniref:Protein root UVB sensitive/RUS domain-containing protein n=1 Tax=Dictyostelium firmibasis TaxID=79012 RepID=A0AAN7UBB5_9MYCE